MSQSHRIPRVASDFSIERILADDSEKKTRESSRLMNEENSSSRRKNSAGVSSRQIVVPNLASCSRLEFPDEVQADFYDSSYITDYTGISCASMTSQIRPSTIVKNELAWLHCTRYRPPKLPRKSSNGKNGKRRPGAHPRIPFTAGQLQILEDKYRNTAYLSRRDVIQLSTTLRLPQSRVKIWFQNRRARDRRENGISGSNVTILADDASSSSRKTPKSPIAQLPSTKISSELS